MCHNHDCKSPHTNQIFMRMGIPKVLTSDNGSKLRNDLEMRLAKALGVKRIYTTPYHPQVSQYLSACFTIS